MNILNWFSKPQTQTIEEYLALEGKKRTDKLIMGITGALERKKEDNKAAMTKEELTILAIEALENEVNNDGYHGFFTHASKECAPIILDSLNAIKADKVASITAKAIECLKIKDPITVEKIDRVVEERFSELIKELGVLDTKFYKLEVDLAEPLLEFIKANKERITLK